MAAEVSAQAKRGRRAAPEAPEPEEERDPSACAAYGCPLPGSISESTTGGGPWLCRHHFGVASSRWTEITTRLRRPMANDELIDAAPSVSPTVQRIREENARRPRIEEPEA